MQEKASKLESDIKDLEMMIMEWKPLGKALDEDSILTWIMQEYENLDIVMKEAEDRGRQINTKDMRNDGNKVLEDDGCDGDVNIDETDQEVEF
jgi:hypothetical protein